MKSRAINSIFAALLQGWNSLCWAAVVNCSLADDFFKNSEAPEKIKDAVKKWRDHDISVVDEFNRSKNLHQYNFGFKDLDKSDKYLFLKGISDFQDIHSKNIKNSLKVFI